ncbi:hypothetical protein CSAL01_12343 [Colletotrichum salicis]|uniref:Uncharacterized protein n=1 Tax=Colletotrichum salicis TaxID=1209931 RepID=A0A135UQU2_9PEZI|nr:hypothetical protein CSAL01_12343 [Colletotrichum salicis]
MDTTPLGVKMDPATLDTVLIWGFGRSDGVGPSPFTKARGESHLVLVDEAVNLNKGKFMRQQKPNVVPVVHTVNSYRTIFREVFGVFEYLRWSPPSGTGGSGPFPVVEPVWNKWMRVSNWFDLVLWEFDNQYAGRWNERAGAPVNSLGSPSLRALYARFIEDYLLGIEETAALKSSEAKTAYEAKFKSLNSLRKEKKRGVEQYRRPELVQRRVRRRRLGQYGRRQVFRARDGVAVNIGAPARI